MIKTLDLDIGIDEQGNAEFSTNKINGYLLMVALPENRIQQTEVLIYPEKLPKMLINLPKKEESIFRVQIDVCDSLGFKSQNMADMPIDDILTVKIRGGIPNTNFPVKIIYDTDVVSTRVISEWLQKQI